jgi:phage-related protein
MADGSVEIEIKAESGDVKKKLDNVGDAAEKSAKGLDDLGDSTANTGKEFGAADVAIGSFVGNALSSLASKVVESIGNIAALAEETREYRDDMAKLDTAFTTAGHSTDAANKSYTDFYAILGESDRSVEAVNHLAELTNNEQELAEWSTIAAGVTAKFGDSLPIEGLTEAANETAKVGQTTGVLADALNWASADSSVFKDALGGNNKAMTAFNKAIKEGLPVEDAFTAALGEMKTEQERSAAITSTLNGLYSDAAGQYNELTASTQDARRATAEMEQAEADLGAAIEPLTTAWTRLKTDGMQWLIDTGLPAIQTGFGWVKDNIPAIATLVGGLAAVWAIYNKEMIITKISTLAAAAAQTALNIAQNMSPLGWIVLGITAVVTAFLLLWNNCEGFRNFFIGMWEGIKAAFQAFLEFMTPAWEAIKAAFQSFIEFITPIWEALKQKFTEVWNHIVETLTPVIAAVVGAFQQAWELIKVVWDKVQPFFAALWEGIKAVFSVVSAVLGAFFKAAWEAIKVVWDLVQPYFKILWEGIKGVFSVVVAVLGGFFKTAWEAIKAVWDTVTGYFKTIWETIKGIFAVVKDVLTGNWKDAWEGIKGIVKTWANFFKGVWNSIKGVFSAVGSWFKGVFQAAWDGIKNVWSSVKEFFSGIWEKIKSAFNIGDMLDIGKNLIKGLWDGINNSVKWLLDKIKGFCGSVLDGFKSFFGIKSPSRVMRDQVGKMLAEGISVGIDEGKDVVLKSAKNLMEQLTNITEKETAATTQTVKDLLTERTKIQKKYADDLKVVKNDETKTIEQKNDEITRLDEQYVKDFAANREGIKKIATTKMQELTKLDEDYKTKATKIWTDLDDAIAKLHEDYANQLESKTKSIADSLGLWAEATKNAVTGEDLQKNLDSQVAMLEDYNAAIDSLSERGVGEEFINELKKLGVKATGEIEALNSMTDEELTKYVETWGEKNALAGEAAREELEPVLVETMSSITQLREDATAEYEQLRADYEDQSKALIEELKEAMMATGDAGYLELISQLDDYKEAGASLMDGVIAGVAYKSPEVTAAVAEAVKRAIVAAKQAAGIASPSKVMKKDVGYNLAAGLQEGWSDKIAAIKDKMATDMKSITARVKTAVSVENARMNSGIGTRDTGFAEIARAVGLQTAGINSLSAEYKRGKGNARPIILQLDRRELGRAVVDVGGEEEKRVGVKLALNGV